MVERFERVGLVRRGRRGRYAVWYRWREDPEGWWQAGPRAEFEQWLAELEQTPRRPEIAPARFPRFERWPVPFEVERAA
jgi:hypothetical protein